MKSLLLSFTLIIAYSCIALAQPNVVVSPKKKITTTNRQKAAFSFKGGVTHDFGTLQEGPVAEYVFEFVNSAAKPLIVESAMASCGCTVPTWTKKPVMPGKIGTIKIAYTTQGRVGAFNKQIYLTSNFAENESDRIVLSIRGTVVAKKEN